MEPTVDSVRSLLAEGRHAEAAEVIAWYVAAAARRGQRGVRLPLAELDGLLEKRLERLGIEVRSMAGRGAPTAEVRLRPQG